MRLSRNASVVARALPFLATAILFIVFFSIVPIFTTVRWSLFRVGVFNSEYVGLANYIEMFKSRQFGQILVNTVVYGLALTPIMIVVPLAIALQMPWLRNRGIIVGLFYMPGFAAGVVIGGLFRWIYQARTGLLNGILRLVGIEGPEWLGDRWLAMFAVSTLALYGGISGIIAVFSASALSVQQTTIDAAMIDGARPAQIRWRIIAPMMRPIIEIQIFIVMVGTIKFWEVIYILAPTRSAINLMYLINETAIDYSRYGMGAAQAMVMMVMVLSLGILARRR